MVDIRWLETFNAVAREGNFSAAAVDLNFARSTVTHHIQSLERVIGAKLFDRSVAGQPLTASGLVMLEHAEVVLAHIDMARLKIAKIVGGEPTVLRLVTTESTAAYRLAVFLRNLQRHLSNIKVNVETASSSVEVRDKLRRGQAISHC